MDLTQIPVLSTPVAAASKGRMDLTAEAQKTTEAVVFDPFSDVALANGEIAKTTRKGIVGDTAKVFLIPGKTATPSEGSSPAITDRQVNAAFQGGEIGAQASAQVLVAEALVEPQGEGATQVPAREIAALQIRVADLDKASPGSATGEQDLKTTAPASQPGERINDAGVPRQQADAGDRPVLPRLASSDGQSWISPGRFATEWGPMAEPDDATPEPPRPTPRTDIGAETDIRIPLQVLRDGRDATNDAPALPERTAFAGQDVPVVATVEADPNTVRNPKPRQQVSDVALSAPVPGPRTSQGAKAGINAPDRTPTRLAIDVLKPATPSAPADLAPGPIEAITAAGKPPSAAPNPPAETKPAKPAPERSPLQLAEAPNMLAERTKTQTDKPDALPALQVKGRAHPEGQTPGSTAPNPTPSKGNSNVLASGTGQPSSSEPARRESDKSLVPAPVEDARPEIKGPPRVPDIVRPADSAPGQARTNSVATPEGTRGARPNEPAERPSERTSARWSPVGGLSEPVTREQSGRSGIAPAPMAAKSAEAPALPVTLPAGGQMRFFDPGEMALSRALDVLSPLPADARWTSLAASAPGTPQQPVPASVPDAARQIAIQIIDNATQSTPRMIEVTLAPEELGRVRMLMTPHENGISVHVQAERGETLDLLRRTADALADDLRGEGFNGVDVSFGGHSHQSGSDDMPEDWSSSGPNLVRDDQTTEYRPMTFAEARTLAQGKRLDLRI